MYKSELEPNPITDAIELLKLNNDSNELIQMAEEKIKTSNDYYHFVGDFNTTKVYWEIFKETILNQNK